MEKIVKDYGCLVMNGDEIFNYEGGNTGEGYVYKDSDAFRSGEGICYISEYGLEELNYNLTELEMLYKNSEISYEKYQSERNKILSTCGETRQTIIEQVKDAFSDNCLMTDEQVEDFAEDVFNIADWAYISTYLAENFEIGDAE